jgi:hypothetical protein
MHALHFTIAPPASPHHHCETWANPPLDGARDDLILNSEAYVKVCTQFLLQCLELLVVQRFRLRGNLRRVASGETMSRGERGHAKNQASGKACTVQQSIAGDA